MVLFFFNDTATTEIYTLSLHDALPIWGSRRRPGTHGPRTTGTRSRSGTRTVTRGRRGCGAAPGGGRPGRSEEHTSELQSQSNLVCRLLLEKKKSSKVTEYDRRSNVVYN